MGNVEKKYNFSSRAEGLESSGSVQRQEMPVGIPKTWCAQWRMGKDRSVMSLMVFPALCFPPQQGSLSQQPGLLWFEIHWWCNSWKDDQASLLHLLKVPLKAAGYSVNHLWIIYFFSIFVTVSMEDWTPKNIFLIHPHCISSDPSWKVLQRIREDIYIPGFYLNCLSASLFL